MPLRVPFPLALAGIVLILAGACSADSSKTGSPGETSAYESAAADALRDQGDPDGVESSATYDQGQQFLVNCMAADGFTYHPVPAPRPTFEAMGLTERAFKLQYGRGISTLLERRQAESAAEPADPNAAERERMSEAERTVYLQTMLRCEGSMMRTLGVVPTVLRLGAGSPLTEAINNATEAASADPRVVEVKDRWSDCMRRQGFDFVTGEMLEQDLMRRVEPLRQAYLTRGQAMVDQGRTWSELKVEDVLTSDEIGQLKTIQSREVAAGAAEVACVDQGVDVTGVARTVRQEYLQQELDGLAAGG